MTKLTDIQLVLLTSACQRADGSLLPPPESLGDQAARIRKAVDTLIKRDYAAEKAGMTAAQAWRTDDGVTIGVVITQAGRAIIEPPLEEGPAPDAPRAGEQPGGEAQTQGEEPAGAPAAAVIRPSKQALVLDLLQREGGTTLADIVAATGWLPHSSRAALTGLRKKGHAITADKVDGITRYQIAAAA